MKPSVSFPAAFLFFELLSIATINFSFCNGSTSNVGCIESERKALVMFKQDLTNTSNRLDSWIGADGDCCKWAGVVCNNLTGHVLELHLGNLHTEVFTSQAMSKLEAEYEPYERSRLGGKLNPSLLDLKHLNYLDLSFNDFGGIWTPRFLGSMESLTYLNLSHAGFSGMILHQFGNLSNLRYLDLSYTSFSAENLFWLSSLPLLEHLDLSHVNLSKASDWLLEINTLPSLKVLKLANCELQHFPPLSVVNFSSLVTLDLSNNYYISNPMIPSWVFGLSHLHFLNMSYNYFQGPIPDGLQNLTALRHLDLSWNCFNSSIPTGLSSMLTLILRSNKFRGFLPRELCNLASLQILDVAHNNLFGAIPRCICNFSAMVTMDSSNVQNGTILNLVRRMDLSRNKFSGMIPTEVTSLAALQLLNLSHNSFTGKIPANFGAMKSLVSVDFSSNQLSGEIPQNISRLNSLSYLNLSNNNLIGKIPMGGQLQTFDPTCFMGNELCGSPLPRNCTSPTPGYNENDGEHGTDWFYVSIALGFVMGFVVGFWSFIGPLIVNRRWSYMYSRFLDRLGEIIGSIVRKCF